MKNIGFITILLLVIFSCKEKTKIEVGFSGFAEQDTIFLYQDGECHFVTIGLVELLKNENVISAKYNLSTSNSLNRKDRILNRENYHSSDTINFGLRIDLTEIDYNSEKFDTKNEYFSFYGKLEVYTADKDTLFFKDSITLTRINPLFNKKMEGELKNNKRVGVWLEYNDDNHNELVRKSTFENGLRQGLDTVYRKGKIAIVSNWLNGKKHGFCRNYRSGYLHSDIIFENGIPNSLLKYYNSNGEVSDSIGLEKLKVLLNFDSKILN